MTTTLHFTPALYRVLSAIDQSGLSISRNGALEPFVHFVAKAGATALIRKGNLDMSHIDKLHKEKLIEFSNNGMYGLYQGTASLTILGTAVLNGPWKATHDRLENKPRVAESSVPTSQSKQAAPEETPRTAAIKRVQQFVDLWPTRSGLHPEDVYILPTMDREKDEVVNVTLRISDLKTLLDAVSR